jgi:hypothetical protein
MSQTVDELRNFCWSQFKKSYNTFNSVFSNLPLVDGVLNITAKEFLDETGLDQGVIVKGRPLKFICRCMDERCQQKRTQNERLEENEVVDLTLPGAGSLLSYAELAKLAEVILKKAKENQVKIIDIYSHEGCGAAALARPRFLELTNDSKADNTIVEKYFGHRAFRIFEQVNQDGNYGIKITEPKHQTADRMMHLEGKPCKNIHPALGIIVSDLVGLDMNRDRFSIHDFLLKSELPFFLITDYGQDLDNCKDRKKSWNDTAQEVLLASQIIQGDHGMGSEFNLPIIFLTNSEESNQRAKVLIKQIDNLLQETKFGNTMDNPTHHHFICISV